MWAIIVEIAAAASLPPATFGAVKWTLKLLKIFRENPNRTRVMIRKATSDIIELRAEVEELKEMIQKLLTSLPALDHSSTPASPTSR